jgi:hypothetical protein
MPFTVSHTAAVLPFRRWLRRPGILAAAVIGSMAPDFDLFLPVWLPRSETHGRLALLTFCLPLGLVAWLLFQALLRPALLQLAPDRWWSWWRQRAAPDLGAWRTWLLTAVAVTGGAVTHLVWDGFTHEGARGVEMIPALEVESLNLAGHPMRLYRLLQHGSSVVGLAIVCWIVWRWHRVLPAAADTAARPLGRPERLVWIAAGLALPLAAAALLALGGLSDVGHEHSLGDWLTAVVVATMIAGVAAALVLGALLRLRIAWCRR